MSSTSYHPSDETLDALPLDEILELYEAVSASMSRRVERGRTSRENLQIWN